MNINTNPEGLPDISALEKLANEFFTALPGDLSKQDTFLQKEITPPNYDSLIDQAGLLNVKDPRTSLPDPNFDGLPNSNFGIITPPSNNIDQGNAVNLKEPQTSLPDPHFAGNGRIPPSIGGSGISPSAFDKGFTSEQIPYLSNQDADLTKVLSSINFKGTSQLPELSSINLKSTSQFPELSSLNLKSIPQLPELSNVGLNDASYYFLKENNKSPFNEKSFAPKTEPGFTGRKEDNFPGLPFDVNLVKKDFPILQERVNGKPLIWLDNAATTQKPKQVIERISYFYEHENSNIHRAAHELAARATDAYEEARTKVQRFLNAGSINEIVFVRGATEAINLVAKSWGEQNLTAGDEIIVSHLEHHANIVPWQQLAAKKGLKIRVIPVDDDGQIILDEYAKLLGPKTKLVSFTQVSNALGTVTPAKTIVQMAHHAGAKVLVDGAQSVSHMRVDVRDLNCDWFVFSGHKVFGPTGIGVVYGKEDLLNATQPWQGGGNMIVDVTFEHTTYHEAPGRFEAGTGNIADAVGLGAAIDYVTKFGMDLINKYEHYLLVYATKLIKDVPGLRIIGTAHDKASVLSFVLEGYRTEEVGAVLNHEGIAVRSGHHCAQPILRRFGLESTVRPSLAFYNTCSDINVLVETLYKLKGGAYKQLLK